VGRDDGREAGEMMALYFRKERFEKLDGGHFWLSEMPDEPGSKSWDSSLPRMVTWVKLRDRQDASARSIAYFNTHFDHQGPIARLESARLVRQRIQHSDDNCSIILTGDFNTAVASEPYHALFDEADGKMSPIIDSYRARHPKPSANEGTFSAFQVSETSGERIDWIGASRDFQVLEASIDHTDRDGRTPSDHFPVTAVLSR
jgi:endonuclease/exonuclease/phosphatase family metal-dependent hydrolase